MPERNKIVEISELKTILSSRTLRRILQQSKTYHQGKVNEYVRAQNLISAYGELCKLNYIDKLADLIQSEYEKLTKEKEEK